METTILGGLVIGSIYVFVALGYNVALLGSGAFNFAQAAIVMMGTFVAYQLALEGLPIIAVVVIGALIGALVGLAIEIVAVHPVQGRGVHGELVTTVGAAIVIEGIVVLVWGDQPLRLSSFVSADIVQVGNGRVTTDGLAMIAVAVLAFLALWSWSKFTLGGLVCLATNEDRVAASLRGVNVRKVSVVSLMVAGALGAGVGPVVGATTLAVVTLGTAITLKAFLALAIGGFGSFPGALIGGFAVGVIEALTSRYVGTNQAAIALFILLLLTLTLKPSGLFGSKHERLV